MKPGELVAGRYTLIRFLGRGGFGEVWAADDRTLGVPRAMKFLIGPALRRPDLRARFLTEARIANAFVHPNLVQVHDVLSLEGDDLVLVMELLEGRTLGKRLEDGVPLSLREANGALGPILSATIAIHERGIVHRDIKPENIFLAETTFGLLMPKLLDFGVAKITTHDPSTGLTSTGAPLGTPCYMAPEQAFGEKDVDARADVFALGVVLYECFTGARPVEAANLGQYIKQLGRTAVVPLRELAPELPEEVAAIVMRMLSVDRGERPALGAVMAALSSRETPPPPAPRAASPPTALVRAAALEDTHAAPTRRRPLETLDDRTEHPTPGTSSAPPPPVRSSQGWMIGVVGGLVLAILSAVATIAVDPATRWFGH